MITMRKKKNLIKRNSGFVIGCVLAGGASFFAADTVLTDKMPDFTMEKESEETPATDAVVLEPEKTGKETYETDPFTVTATGSLIKGIENEQTEKTEESESENTGDAQMPESGDSEEGQTAGDGENQTAEGGNAGEGQSNEGGETGESQIYEGGDEQTSTGDGSGQTVEIYDSENGDYSYTDDGSWADNNSGSGDGTWTDNSSGSGDDSWTDNGSGSGDDSWTDNGSGSDDIIWIENGSGSGDDSWTDNGSGSGDNNSGSGSNGSGSSDGAWTPDEVIIQGISSRYISESELYNYDQGQLRLIRNEIFALNGRIFRSQDLADYFSQRSWYVPTYDPDEFDANMFYYLNDYEEANLQVILDYEAALGY